MKGIYLAAFKAFHPGYDILYQDINGKRDIGGDMMQVDLTPYDFIIASPPCNYWSRANYRRDVSAYSLNTRHLLPDILDKLIKLNKPFIVENVRSPTLFSKYGLFDKNCFVYLIGRHTYFTNVMFYGDLNKYKSLVKLQNLPTSKRQGTFEVHVVIDNFLSIIHGGILNGK